MSKNEVPALIAAVKEHQKFRQLACYSIECLSKVIDPVNRDYKKNLAVAHSCNAGKCVVDVLKRHPGKEDVLLVCCDCLKKLAVDTANAEVIAEEGCVDAILASLAANPELPEETLAIALSILDTLCNHNKALQTLVSRGTVKLLVDLIQAGNQKNDVKVGCLKALAKLTKVQKGIDDFISCDGVGPTIAAMNSLSLSPIQNNSEIAVALTSGCKLFARLSPKEPQIKQKLDLCGGTDICLSIMDKAEDPQLNKICSKLLSHLCGSESIDNVITNLKDTNSLSVEKQERMLGLLSSLTMDSTSSTDIVRSGGVKVLIQSVEKKVSARQLETSTKALLGLATNNTMSIKELVQDGAISALTSAVQLSVQPTTQKNDVKSLLETKANAVQALTCISSVAENVSLVVESGSVQAILEILSTETENSALSTSSMMFLESLCGHGGALDELIQSADVDTIIQSLCTHPDNDKLHLAAMKVFIDLATSEETLKSFIDKDLIEVVINSIYVHHENETILKEALFLLSTLLFRPNTIPKVHSACDGTGLQIVTNAIYKNIRHDEIRKVSMELISQLSGEDMIQKVVSELNDIALQAKSNLTSDAMIRIRSIAMTISVLSMVPENLSKIGTSGGILPLTILLNIMSNLQANDIAHSEALTTLFSSLEEIIAYGDNSMAGIDVKSIINSCVSALQKHSKIPEIVMSSLRLLSAISSFTQYKLVCIENDALQAINNIARQYASNTNILEPIVNIYLNISSSDDDIAINLAKHNSTKMIMHCIRDNLINDLQHIESITSLVRILNRLAMLNEGSDILKRQGCVSCLFDVFECFNSSDDIKNLCLLTIQILMNEKDIQEILNRLYEKSTDSTLFSLTEQSVDSIEKATLDMQRLGLLMLCGPEVVEQIENTGGVQLIQNYLAGFSPTINPNTPENSLVSRARDEFANRCIEALGRAALHNTDIEATVAAVPLIVQVAANNPTPEVFATMKTLCQGNEPVLAAIAAGGGTSICLEICQTGNYDPDVMASAFSLLSTLAINETGLNMIVESNATDLICNHISDSLMSDTQTDTSSITSLQSAINVLQSLSIHNNDNNINYSILKALSEVIESLASWTRNYDGKLNNELYPDLLSSTINVVISLLTNNNSDEYASLLIDSGDIAKIDRIMYSHDDIYLKYSLPTHSLADMLCLLINKNTITNQYVKDLGSQEYLLRTMNYHPTDMSLQLKLANAIGGLGMDAALSGLSSFIEQVDSLILSYSSDIIPQISQYVQLIGNLMLIGGALNVELSEHLFQTLLNTCNCLIIPVESSVQSERDEALYTTITCFGKLLAMESFNINDDNLQKILEFSLLILRDGDSYLIQPEIKVSIMRILRNLIDIRSKALELILKLPLFNTIQQLTPGTVLLALAANRRGNDTTTRSGGKVSNIITAQSFTLEQNLTIDLILKKLIDNLLHLELLTYKGIYDICDMISSQNTQNPGEINWKVFLDKLYQQFGYNYLLDMLSEFRTPLSPYASFRSNNIITNITKAISEKLILGITSGEIISFDQQHHLDAIISTSIFLLPNTSLHFLDCLANTPSGAYAILQKLELIQYLINSMKVSSTSLHASSIIVKIASHEIEGTMKLLIDNGLTKQILTSLKNTIDESYIQNAVYLLRVFADSIGISELRLPKETIKIMSDLTLRFSGNEYLASVAGSISGELSEAFSIGPEAQIETQLNLFMNLSNNGNLWQQLISPEQNLPYYYNATTGASQWDEPSEYQTQIRVLDDILELLSKLNWNMSDVAVSNDCNDMIYSLLYSHSGDKTFTNKLIKIPYSQIAKSNKTTLESLNETHAAYVAHVLQLKLAESNNDIQFIEECLEISEALCALERLRVSLNGEEYIRVLCETCSTHIKLPQVLNKGLSTLSILAKTSSESAKYCIKYNLPDIVVNSTRVHLSSVSLSELRKLILATTAQTSQVSLKPDANSHRKSIIGPNSLSVAETILLASASPVIVLFFTIINVFQSFSSDIISDLRLIVCKKSITTILEILKLFQSEILFTTKIIKLLGSYSLDDNCVDIMLHNGSVKSIVTAVKDHMTSAAVMKITLELLSNLASLEEEPTEEEDYLSPAELFVDQGGLNFISLCIKSHEDKPSIISAAMDAMYNVVDENTVSDIGKSDIIEYSYNTLARYDYNREIIQSILQLLTNIASYNIGLDIFSNGNTNRLSVLFDMLESHIGDTDILKALLEYLYHIFIAKENRELLANNGGINILFTIMSMYSEDREVISVIVRVLSRLSTLDSLSEVIAERGCRQLMELITTFIDDSDVVASIFSLLGQLAFIKTNLKSIVQYGGIRILLDTMEVSGEEEALMISAIRTLDNIIIADEEYANIVIEKGGKEAVEKLQATYPKSATELQELAASALLGMSARARAKGREGTKTNKGALFARINDVVDIEQAMRKEEVKASQIDTTMPDPLLPQYRTLLRAGQVISDYVKGTSSNRHLFLTSDCEHVILKETSTKVSKPGRKIPLRNLVGVSRGYGPGHYKSSLLGGKKTSASEERSLYIQSDVTYPDDEICLEFNTAGDREKWFEVVTALLLASSSCPHYLQSL